MLVAISIPIFTTQLEKSREATDAANLRAAYAEITAALLTWDGTSIITPITVDAKQTQANWQGVDYSTAPNEIGGQQVTATTTSWTVSAVTTAGSEAVTITVTP